MSYIAPKDKQFRFEYLADKIENLIAEEGLNEEVEFSTDQYNNMMKVYYESSEQYDANTDRWRIRALDEDRWEDEPRPEDLPKEVKFTIYAHSSDESIYERAQDAGMTMEEIDKSSVAYAGYEIRGEVTFNRETGKYEVEWDK